MNFFAELKRRHIYRVAAAYAVVAWVLLQLINNVAPGLNLPNWAVTLVIVLLALGFPIALVFAWIHQLALADGAAPRAAASRLDWALMGALVLVIALVSYQQLAPARPATTAQKQQAGVEAARAAATTPSTAISIAVLPFANLSSDPEQEFFSDGMTEEITTALAKIPDLRVVARESAFQFKGEKKDLRTVGQTLGATHLIEGSVRKAGTRVRITAQLIKADDGTNVWAESYDRDLKDVFAVQEEIARAITASLRMPLGLKPGENLVNNRGIDPESYEQYLRAKALFNNRRSIQGPKPLVDAAALLEQIVARNPSYAPAWARLALVYAATPVSDPLFLKGTAAEQRVIVERFFQKTDDAARRAIQLDAVNADAYVALAILQSLGGKLIPAEQLFKQALSLDPNNPDALVGYSDELGAVGRLKEALARVQDLRALDPLSDTAAGRNAALLWSNGDSASAIDLAKGRRQGGANTAWLAEVYASLGRYSEAADTLTMLVPSFVTQEKLEAAIRLLRTAPVKTPSSEKLPDLGYLGFVYLYVGAPLRSLEPFERDVETGHQFLFEIGHLWHPVYAPVRKTERFKAFVRKAGLVDYWEARGWPDLCRPTAPDDFVCD